jgi:hypothetical protein
MIISDLKIDEGMQGLPCPYYQVKDANDFSQSQGLNRIQIGNLNSKFAKSI